MKIHFPSTYGALLATATLIGSAAAVPAMTMGPDLVTVGNVRATEDVNGSGPNDMDTLVDFTFDEESEIVSCCNRFQVVLADGSGPYTGIVVLNVDEQTTTFQVAFEESFVAADLAYGTVDKNIVRTVSDGTGNAPQTEPVEGGSDGSVHPELVSVTRDGDQMFFRFDERIDRDDDVIQNGAGLRFFTENTDTYSSKAVKMGNDGFELRAIFDLPPDVTLEDAVGGFVIAGTVLGTPDSDDFNELTEVGQVGDTGAMVCPPSPLVGGMGTLAGPTDAPDLLMVGNFRRGPFTAQYEPTTCVDFTFDQIAYLKGTRANFKLVPLNGGDALPGSTNVIPTEMQDPEGDNIVTVAFPGDLSPNDFARGFVDTKVVSSAESSPTSEMPFNINQAKDIPLNILTENPDLTQTSFVISGSSLRNGGRRVDFSFDEALTTDDVIQSTSGLCVFFKSTTQSATIPNACAVKVQRISPTRLRARFRDLPEDYTLFEAVGAYVVQGTVQSAPGSQGGNVGKNAFDSKFLVAV